MFQTFLLLGVLTLLLVFLGRFFLGRFGMIAALVLATVLNLGSYWFSDRIVLRMHGAREVSERESPVLHAAVKKLSSRAGLPMPRVYVIPSESPNAFATGRDPEHAAVAATVGILKLLRPAELDAVIGHELAHVEHRDILIGSVAATLAGAVSVLGEALRWSAFWGRSDREGGAVGTLARLAAGIVAPVAALIIQMAVSRTREYAADAEGARLSGQPLALAAALSKLESSSRRVPMREARPSTAHLYIVNPLHGSFLQALFSTHPPTKDRVARLEAMAREGR